MVEARFLTTGVVCYSQTKGEDYNIHVITDPVGDISMNYL